MPESLNQQAVSLFETLHALERTRPFLQPKNRAAQVSGSKASSEALRQATGLPEFEQGYAT